MKKNKIVVYNTEGQPEYSVECRGYHITYERDIEGNLSYIRRLDTGRYDEKHWIMNYRYRPITQQLVERFQELSHINPDKILFIEDIDWKPKADAKRPWMARIGKANKQLNAATGYEYVLETRKHYTENMSTEQLIALLYHELRHIDTDGSIVKHDIEDWNNMIATLGVDWASTVAQIPNILDDKFPGWKELPGRVQQISLFAAK